MQSRNDCRISERVSWSALSQIGVALDAPTLGQHSHPTGPMLAPPWRLDPVSPLRSRGPHHGEQKTRRSGGSWRSTFDHAGRIDWPSPAPPPSLLSERGAGCPEYRGRDGPPLPLLSVVWLISTPYAPPVFPSIIHTLWKKDWVCVLFFLAYRCGVLYMYCVTNDNTHKDKHNDFL